MRLERFTIEHKQQLENWFTHDNPENIYIKFYSDPAKWLELADNQHRFAMAATIDNRLVGFADIEFDDMNGSSFAFGIDPKLRGRGFGKKLVTLVESFARRHGAATLLAGVEDGNTASKHLLESYRFNVVSTEHHMTNYIKQL